MTDNTQANTREQNDRIDFDQIHELEPGDAIAVRAVQDRVTTILAGQIEQIQSIDPEDLLKKMLDESGEDDTVSYSSYVHIDADIWWRIDGKEVKDESARLQDRPPQQPNLDEPPIDAPLCSLAVGSDRSVALVIPTKDTNNFRVVGYYPGPFSPVVEWVSGPIVEPTRVVPDAHDPPESPS